MESLPSLDILVREPEGYSIWDGPPFNNNQPSVKSERVPCISAKFSEDGSRLMVMKSDSMISLYDGLTYKEIRSFEVPNVAAAALSPSGAYLQTFQKATTPQEKNVTLWKIDSGDPVYQHFQKNMTKATWPSIRFSFDEAVACRLATNEIQFFDARDFSKGLVNRLRIPGVAAFELSHMPGSHVAAYVPESKVCHLFRGVQEAYRYMPATKTCRVVQLLVAASFDVLVFNSRLCKCDAAFRFTPHTLLRNQTQIHPHIRLRLRLWCRRRRALRAALSPLGCKVSSFQHQIRVSGRAGTDLQRKVWQARR